jgi:glycosyltransferase involved in cell wall biosynthesis
MYLATEVITVSEDMRRFLLKINKQKKVSLIANGSACGIELSQYDRQKYDHQRFCDDHRLSYSDRIITYIGRPEIRKGFLVALNIWLEYFQVKTNYKLFLCGPTEDDVKKFLGQVPKNIHCLGFTKEIPKILANTDYLILPSFHEGLSYAVLEAMASECIVIANDIDGIRNLVNDGVNGFLIRDNCVENYAKLVISLEDKPDQVQSKIKQAGRKTSTLYSRDVFLAAYQCYLQDILYS